MKRSKSEADATGEPCARQAGKSQKKTEPQGTFASPFLFLDYEAAAEVFGFSRKTLTELAGAGAPVVAKKINPRLLMAWMEKHVDEIASIAKRAE